MYTLTYKGWQIYRSIARSELSNLSRDILTLIGDQGEVDEDFIKSDFHYDFSYKDISAGIAELQHLKYIERV